MFLESWEPPGEAETQQGREFQEWELPRALNLDKSTKHVRWTHSEQVLHCSDPPL